MSSARCVNELLAHPETHDRHGPARQYSGDVLASALPTSLLINLFGEVGVVYATVVMTALIVIFAAVLPKTYRARLCRPRRACSWRRSCAMSSYVV